MTGFAPTWRATMAVVSRDFHVYLSYRTRAVTEVVSTFFSLCLFYYVSRLVTISGFANPDKYFAFVIVGIAMMQIIFSCFSIPGLVSSELVMGTFERMLLSPFGALRAILAMSIFPFISALGVSTATFALGGVFFGLKIHWATAPLAIPAVGLAVLAFLPFAMVFAALAVSVKQGGSSSRWIVAILSLVGGLYFPVTLLPGWVQVFSNLQPFTPAAQLLRWLTVATPMQDAWYVAAIKLTAFASIALPLTALLLSRAVAFGQRRGTIIEY